jgi:hypothetical protein
MTEPLISTESTEGGPPPRGRPGAEEYLVKPFEAGDLVEKLRRLPRVV